MRAFPRILAIAALCLNASCVTIINGMTQQIPVYSYPVAAQIVVQDEDGTVAYSGPSAGVATLKRAHTYTIRAKAPGFADAEATVEPTTSGAAVVGALLGMFVLTPIGTVVDLVDGSCKGHDEEGIEVTLFRQQASGVSAGVPVAFSPSSGCSARTLAPAL